MKILKLTIASALAVLLLGTLKAGIAQSEKKSIFLEPRNPSEQFIFLTNDKESIVVCPLAKNSVNCIDRDGKSVTKEKFIKAIGFKSIIKYETIVLNNELYYLIKVFN